MKKPKAKNVLKLTPFGYESDLAIVEEVLEECNKNKLPFEQSNARIISEKNRIEEEKTIGKVGVAAGGNKQKPVKMKKPVLKPLIVQNTKRKVI
jgi:hypothetical protein